MQVENLGPYRIVRELGRGGMGTVYEAVNRETAEPAAIKLLAPHLAGDGNFRERFAAEIETLRKLRHPRIVRLFGFGEQEDSLYYAMELVDGCSLEEELRQGRRFTWREVTDFAIDVCAALRHAHDRGVIHRDLKPGNLLLATDGHVKLSDFGIARLFGATGLTNVGSVLGTAEYMAPEQAEGKPVGPRADLYSLGAVMYVLLAGRPLFQGKSLPELLHKQRFEQPEPLRNVAPDVPAPLREIVMLLLAKAPEDRVPNPDILARQLMALKEALSVDDPESSPTVATSRFAASSDDDSTAKGQQDGMPRDGRVENAKSEVITSPATAAPGSEHDSAASDSSSESVLEGRTEPMLDRAEEQLPVTKPGDGADDNNAELPPVSVGPLKETKATTAFGHFAHAATERENEPPEMPTGRFVSLGDDDLDRPVVASPEHPLISWQTWILVALLLALGATTWYFLQPPTADALYEQISSIVGSGGISSLLRADDDIEDFLSRFPDDRRCGQLREYVREIELYRLERRFALRARGIAGTESLLPIERDYLAAINTLQVDRDLGMKKLEALIGVFGHRADAAGPVGQCLELARRRLTQLQEQLAREGPQHLALLQTRLNHADQQRATNPHVAEEIYRGMIELYGGKPWAEPAVKRAEESLEQLQDAELPKNNAASTE